MKRLSIFTSLVLLASLASCSNGNNKSEVSSAPSFHYELTEDYSDKYVSLKYDKSWKELDDLFNGPAFTISGSSEVHVYYTFFDVNKISNDTYIGNNIPSGENIDSCTYTNNNNIKFLKIWKSNAKMYSHATQNCVINIEFDNCYDLHYKLIDDFLNNIDIKIPDTNQTVAPITTTKSIQRTTKSIAPRSKTFNGSGDTVTEAFYADGCTRIKGEYKGESYFNVTLYDSEGNYESMVFSNVGQYTGEKVFKFEADKQYMFEVSAKEGDWKISIE